MKDNMYMRRNRFILFGVFAVLAFALLYLAPYTRDDWAWGSSIGLERLSEFFKDYNGRYAGNLVEITLTRVRWLRALVETSVLCGLVFFMAPKGTNRVFFYILAMCMILLEPVAVLRQTVIYTAGFSNYVIPTLFMLAFIRYFEPLIHAEKIEDLGFKPVHSLPIAIAAFVSCLFMEHITLYLLGLSMVITLYSLRKFRKVFAPGTGFVLGSLAGALLMFSNGAYWNVLSGSDNYRSIGSAGSSPGTADTYIQDINHTLFAQNWFFNIILCLTVFLIIKKYKDDMDKKGIANIGKCSVIMLLILTALSWISFFTGTLTELFGSIPMLIIYPVLIIVCFMVLIASVKGGSKMFLIFILVSIVAVNMPLVIVNPVSPRCFFPAFILMCIFIMECLKHVRINKSFVWGTSAALLLSFIGLFMIYIPMYKGDIERVSYIKEQAASGEERIIIGHIPNESFIWIVTPESDTYWERRYKLFYDIPEEIKLINEEAVYESN